MSDWKDEFVQACRDNNLKVTPQRVAIYDYLINTESHPSATDVYQALKPEFPNMSFETVNRTLITYKEIGLANSVQVSDKRKRFDGDISDHQHVFCSKCNKIVDVPSADISGIEMPAFLAEEFTLLRTTVTFEAICKSCLEKIRANILS